VYAHMFMEAYNH